MYILSPTLFSIFLNEIANKIEEFGRHGVQLIPGLVELFILLFADDLALMASTSQGLQNQLDILMGTCKQLGVEINTTKTKAMVFRNGGFLAKNEKWYLGGEQLEVKIRIPWFYIHHSWKYYTEIKATCLKRQKSSL